MTAQDLVNAGYGGYAGWGNTEAAADFAATGGNGKWTGGGGGTTGGANGNGTGSSYQPISPSDYTSLQTQAYAMVQPYYLQLATEAQGDLTRAKQALVDDYNLGVKQAKQDYATNTANTTNTMQNSLASLGVTFNGEQQGKISDLNSRGAAVYQQNPDGTPNVVAQSNINANPDYTSSISNPANLSTTGQGGYEMNQMLQDQKLRNEAVQRTAQNNINTYLNTLTKQVGNTPDGQMPSTTADRSTLGSLGNTYLQGVDTATRQAQLTDESLAQQRSQDINNIANQFAGIQAKTIPTALTQQYLKNTATDFVNSGA